jgi:hypothetical protein
MRRSLAITAAAATLALAGCSSSAKPTPPTAPSSPSPSATSASPTKPPATPTPTSSGTPTGGVSASATATLAAGVSVATQGHDLPSGPFSITAIHCGAYTGAEQAQFGTTAKGGLIYRYTNLNSRHADTPKLMVNFTQGAEVLADNVTTSSAPALNIGQTSEAAVDAVDSSGNDIAAGFGCQLTGYGFADTPAVTYAP